jgi:hypothetical protein
MRKNCRYTGARNVEEPIKLPEVIVRRRKVRQGVVRNPGTNSVVVNGQRLQAVAVPAKDLIETVVGIDPNPARGPIQLGRDNRVPTNLSRTATLEPYPLAINVKVLVKFGSIPLDPRLCV